MKANLPSVLVLMGAACAPLSYAQPKLEEVVVTASRIETPVRQVGAAVSVVGQEEIALRGYASMAELLRTQPGIAVTNAGGPGKASALRIRGEEGYRTLMMIDGVDISDPTGVQVGPQVQHLLVGSDVEKVEILRGPQGFVYGADAGGVVNIITRRAEGLASEFATEAGRYNTRNLQGFFAASDDQLDAFMSFNQQSTDGFNARSSDTSNESDGYDNTTWHGKFGVTLADAWRAQLVLRSTDATSEYDGCGYPASNDCYSDFEQNIGKLSFIYKQAALTHSIAASYTDTDRRNMANGSPSFSTDGYSKKTEYVGSVAVTPSFKFVWGGDAENQGITSNDGKRDDRNQYGVFAEAQTQVDDAFYLSAGLRFDDNQDFGEHLSARIAPAYIMEVGPTSSVKYRASWGTGFRAPSLSEIAYNARDGAHPPAANVVLKEETSEGFDVGVEFYFASGYSVQIGYFDQQIENEIFFDLNTYSGYLQEQGISHSRGGELAFDLPVLPFLTVTGSYTYNDTLTDEDQQRVRRPRHLANLALVTNAYDQRVRMLINLRAARDAVNDIYGVGRVPLDDYHVIDVSAHYQPASALTLFARLANAADEQYQELTDYNTSGRAFSAGIKFSF